MTLQGLRVAPVDPDMGTNREVDDQEILDYLRAQQMTDPDGECGFRRFHFSQFLAKQVDTRSWSNAMAAMRKRDLQSWEVRSKGRII